MQRFSRFVLVLVGVLGVSACGDLHRSFNGQASDGSLIASDVNMLGLGSVMSGDATSRNIEDVFSIQLQSTKGWSCSVDYESMRTSNGPDNAIPIQCSDGSKGLIILNKSSNRGFTFGLSNGVTGSVSSR